MRVHEWMSPDPVTVSPAATVREARDLLYRYGVRHIPVVRRDRLVGIVSDRDVRIEEPTDRACPPDPSMDPSLPAAGRLVEQVMSSPPHTIGADEPVEAAARLMLSRHISALPVLDGGRLVGIVTTTDCLLALLSPQSTILETR